MRANTLPLPMKSRNADREHIFCDPIAVYRRRDVSAQLYHGSKLTSAEEIDASLEDAKRLATAAIADGQAHRAELVNTAGSVIFQRWAVL